MLITTEELKTFSGNYDGTNAESYIKAAQDLIETSIGYDPETSEEFKEAYNVENIVYSGDEIHWYSDAEMTQEVDIPAGVEIIPTLVENQYEYITIEWRINPPEIIKQVCKEIATLMQLEENQNLGVNSKSFGESGTRTFLNVTNYDPYLKKISKYKRAGALKF